MLPDDHNEESVDLVEIASEDDVDIPQGANFSDAVLHSTDWTAETIVGQLRRGNIILNPQFQRRDAWKIQQKSRLIESLILGLPVPQIVLAEKKDERGKFIVLDGKQRLLTLLQFWGLGEGENNAYSLSGLQVRTELNRKAFAQISTDPGLRSYYDALLNQSIRTVVIKNWPTTDFLHLVFLRLNTGSVKLSPQELRQAIVPGGFTTWVDKAAMASAGLKRVLKLTSPDYRMRDIELLARHFAFRSYIKDYKGRMKEFLDSSFTRFNDGWPRAEEGCNQMMLDFELAVESLEALFGERLARKPGVKQINKALFDFLIYYASRQDVRQCQQLHRDALLNAYERLFDNRDFTSAVDRDTAGLPSTVTRFAAWAGVLNALCDLQVPVPAVEEIGGESRIVI